MVCVGVIVEVAVVFILYVLISIGLKVIVVLAKILYNIKSEFFGSFSEIHSVARSTQFQKWKQFNN